MILKVKNKKEVLLATVEFAPKNELKFIGEYDQDFFDFVSKIIQQGWVDALADIPESKNVLSIIKRRVSKDDPNFHLAFKQFLERKGYDVEEKHPEVEKEIRQLLADFPDEDLDKQDILKRLPDMSYLEQTIILEGLHKINKE